MLQKYFNAKRKVILVFQVFTLKISPCLAPSPLPKSLCFYSVLYELGYCWLKTNLSQADFQNIMPAPFSNIFITTRLFIPNRTGGFGIGLFAS